MITAKIARDRFKAAEVLKEQEKQAEELKAQQKLARQIASAKETQVPFSLRNIEERIVQAIEKYQRKTSYSFAATVIGEAVLQEVKLELISLGFTVWYEYHPDESHVPDTYTLYIEW